MEYPVKIISHEKITHDVVQVVTEKPTGFSYNPGQAADVSVNKEGWRNELRPFTFTSLPTDDFLEFNIKTYPSHKGVTEQILHLQKGDSLILHDVFGEITYKGEGTFIAGGAGITPFIAILRYLRKKDAVGNNKLVFANKTKGDILHEEEFRKMLGNNFINVLSDENVEGFEHGYINQALLAKHVKVGGDYIYLCGPPPMMDQIEKILAALSIDPANIVKEGF